MDREAWRAMVHEVTKSQTWLKQLSMHVHNLPQPLMQLFLSPYSLFVCCCWRRRLSRCKHCSKGPQVPAVSPSVSQEHFHQPAVGRNHLMQSLLFNKVLRILCKWLTTELKSRRVVWVQKGCKYISCLPSWSWGWLGIVATSQHLQRGWDYVTGVGKETSSKFQVQFLLKAYYFHKGKPSAQNLQMAFSWGRWAIIVCNWILLPPRLCCFSWGALSSSTSQSGNLFISTFRQDRARSGWYGRRLYQYFQQPMCLASGDSAGGVHKCFLTHKIKGILDSIGLVFR